MTKRLLHQHRAVFVKEVLEGLDVQPRGLYVDGTIGSGGHAAEILKASSPHGRVLGIDQDPEALARAKKNLRPYGDRILLQEGNYVEIERILRQEGFKEAHGVLLDLGASYEQLTSGRRGFSFNVSGPLDMRFNPHALLTAQQIIDQQSEKGLRDLFRAYGEERWAGRIARAIVSNRPISSTGDLSRLISKVVPKRGRIHPATRVFQALRIAVNRELENVEKGIRAASACLKTDGRLCVIAYHSLEDRIVKRLFRELTRLEQARTYEIITRKPLTPDSEEIRENPRARGAKLRVLQAA